MWRIWAKALGEKAGNNDEEADKVALIRSVIMFQLVLTNSFIIAGNVKNLWFSQDNGTPTSHLEEKCEGFAIQVDRFLLAQSTSLR